MARGLKYRIKEEEGLFYLSSENKDADQLHGNICVFAYAKSRFSHEADHIICICFLKAVVLNFRKT